jgi:hypothetical protein
MGLKGFSCRYGIVSVSDTNPRYQSRSREVSAILDFEPSGRLHSINYKVV